MNIGKRPYEEMEHLEVRNFVCRQGGHLRLPSICPQSLSDQLYQCWAYDPNERPSFENLLNAISELLPYKIEFQARICSKAGVL